MLRLEFRSIRHPWMLCDHCIVEYLGIYQPIDHDVRALPWQLRLRKLFYQMKYLEVKEDNSLQFISLYSLKMYLLTQVAHRLFDILLANCRKTQQPQNRFRHIFQNDYP